MSKLLSLKEWITLEEAATYLSGVFSESVTVADLYRFALAGHLILTANFVNHGRANPGRRLPIREAGFTLLPGLFLKDEERKIVFGLDEFTLPHFQAWADEDPSVNAWLDADEPKSKWVRFNGKAISADDCLQFEKAVFTLDGLWDLAMVGGERVDIEHALQQETGGPNVELVTIDGVVVFRPDGTYARVLEHFSDNEFASEESKTLKWNDPAGYYPAGGIPSDAPIVVRPSELARFVSALQPDRVEKPLLERERATLLCIIGALARQYGLDLSQPMKAGDAVAAMAPELELSGRTIGEKLKLVGEAMDRRAK